MTTAESHQRPPLVETFSLGFRVSPEFRKGLGVTFVLAVFAAVGRAAVPYLTQRITDEGLLAAGGVDSSVALHLAWIGVAVLVTSALLAWVVRSRLVTAAEAGLATLRKKAFAHVHRLSVLTQNEEQRGRYISRITGDVDVLRDFVQWTGAGMVVSALEMVVVLAAMFVYSWQLACVVMVSFVPLALVVRVLYPRINGAYVTVRGQMADLLARASEHIVGVATIQSYGVQRRMRDRLRAQVDDVRATERRAGILASAQFSAVVVGQALATGLTLIVGTALAIDGTLSVGTVVAFAFLVYMFAGPLMWIIEQLAEMQRSLVGWRRVLELVEAPESVVDAGEAGTDLPEGRLGIAVRDVRMTYDGGPEILRGVTLDVPAGEQLALVGQTGSGKTTLARLIVRFMDPSAGAIEIGGVDMREVPMSRLRTRVTVVPQEGFLFDGTIADNLAYGALERDREWVERQGLAAFNELGLADWLGSLSTGLDTPVGPRGDRLSAGERQLVAIARAYLRDPDVLLLDEATSAVDPVTEVRISRALEALMRGRTSIVIAHRLSTAERADRIAVMADGELVEVGAHRALVAAGGHYARMHAAWVAQTRD